MNEILFLFNSAFQMQNVLLDIIQNYYYYYFYVLETKIKTFSWKTSCRLNSSKMGEYKTQSSNKNEIIINVLPYCHLLLHHGHVQISRIKNLNSIIMGLSSLPFRYDTIYTLFIINTRIFIIFHPLNIFRQSGGLKNTFIIQRCTFNLYGNITSGIWAGHT